MTPDEVLRLARLTRIALEPAEAERVRGDLLAMLDFARGTLGPAGELATADPGRAPLRDDRPGAEPLAYPPAALAPEWDDGCFLVPSERRPGGSSAEPGGDVGEPGTEHFGGEE